MKATITRPDGTRIDLEGTAEEIERVVGAAQPSIPQYVPFHVPSPGPHRENVLPPMPYPRISPTTAPWMPEPYVVPTWTIQPFLAVPEITCGGTSS